MKKNPYAVRIEILVDLMRRYEIDVAVIQNEANIRSLTDIECDSATLVIPAKGEPTLYTDFRYGPMIRRTAPWIKLDESAAFSKSKCISRTAKIIGFEESLPYSIWEKFLCFFPHAQCTKSISDFLSLMRETKIDIERDKIRAAAALNDKIWKRAQRRFLPGMTERDMARVIKHLMIDLGDGEAFPTIVCIGKNAAECHHIPGDTAWDGKRPILVDMGVKLNGYCSDMTRNIIPSKPTKLYCEVYNLVLEANERAIAAAKPGVTCAELDAVARDFLTKNGYGKAFGHALGHGVGLEIHEAPTLRKNGSGYLAEGTVVTIEPGIYLEGKLGVRIEDLILITETGCEVLSHSRK